MITTNKDAFYQECHNPPCFENTPVYATTPFFYDESRGLYKKDLDYVYYTELMICTGFSSIEQNNYNVAPPPETRFDQLPHGPHIQAQKYSPAIQNLFTDTSFRSQWSTRQAYADPTPTVVLMTSTNYGDYKLHKPYYDQGYQNNPAHVFYEDMTTYPNKCTPLESQKNHYVANVLPTLETCFDQLPHELQIKIKRAQEEKQWRSECDARMELFHQQQRQHEAQIEAKKAKQAQEQCESQKQQRHYWSQQKRNFPLAKPLRKPTPPTRAGTKIMLQQRTQAYQKAVNSNLLQHKETIVASLNNHDGNHYAQRLKAFEYTRNNPDVFEQRDYDFETDLALNLLAECMVDKNIFKNNYVNALQHEINYEVVDLITQAASVHFNTQQTSLHHLMHSVVYGGVAAKSASEQGLFAQSFNCLNWCDSLLKYGKQTALIIGGVAQGFGTGLFNVVTAPAVIGYQLGGVANYLLNDDRAAEQLTQTAFHFMRFLYDLIPPDKEFYDDYGLHAAYITDRQKCDQHWHAVFEKIAIIKDHLIERCKTLQPHEIARYGAQYVTEFFPGTVFKCLTAFSNALKAEKPLSSLYAITKNKSILSQAPATALLNEVSGVHHVYECAQQSAVTAKAFDVVSKNSAVMGSLAHEGVPGVQKFLTGIQESVAYFDTVRTSESICPIRTFWESELFLKELKGQEFVNHISPLFNSFVNTSLQDAQRAHEVLKNAQFDLNVLEKAIDGKCTTLSRDFIAKHLPKKLNTGHILAPEIVCEKSGEIVIKGFHLDKEGLLTKSGIIQVNNIKILEYGFYTGIPSCCGFVKNKGFSSFFPQ
ncbi:MAG: hypothetical protein WA432_00480, partial [Candidatus Babeliaceae bacterium]